MIYYIFLYLKHFFPFFDKFQVVWIRFFAALCTSFLFSLVYGALFIRYFREFFKSKVREYTPDSHRQKENTLTMGGLFISMAIVSTIFLWCDFLHPYVLLFLACLCCFCLLGCIDDVSKVYGVRGISARTKFRLQCLCALVVSVTLMKISFFSTNLVIPFIRYKVTMGWWFIPWAMLIIVGSSNAVNLTDGLDGLVTNILLPNYALFALICYLSGHSLLALYFGISMHNSTELAIVCAALIGSLLGFLWYNVYPARVFMGDVGSLPLGACLGLLALMVKKECMLAFSGGIFVIETLSVIAQVISIRLFKKRLFKIAPLHHHFELTGLHESMITARFAIITLFLCLYALLMLQMW